VVKAEFPQSKLEFLVAALPLPLLFNDKKRGVSVNVREKKKKKEICFFHTSLHSKMFQDEISKSGSVDEVFLIVRKDLFVVGLKSSKANLFADSGHFIHVLLLEVIELHCAIGKYGLAIFEELQHFQIGFHQQLACIQGAHTDHNGGC
jgi:hypothetical protein